MTGIRRLTGEDLATYVGRRSEVAALLGGRPCPMVPAWEPACWEPSMRAAAGMRDKSPDSACCRRMGLQRLALQVGPPTEIPVSARPVHSIAGKRAPEHLATSSTQAPHVEPSRLRGSRRFRPQSAPMRACSDSQRVRCSPAPRDVAPRWRNRDRVARVESPCAERRTWPMGEGAAEPIAECQRAELRTRYLDKASQRCWTPNLVPFLLAARLGGRKPIRLPVLPLELRLRQPRLAFR
jgi:hypothetical protein